MATRHWRQPTAYRSRHRGGKRGPRSHGSRHAAARHAHSGATYIQTPGKANPRARRDGEERRVAVTSFLGGRLLLRMPCLRAHMVSLRWPGPLLERRRKKVAGGVERGLCPEQDGIASLRGEGRLRSRFIGGETGRTHKLLGHSSSLPLHGSRCIMLHYVDKSAIKVLITIFFL